MKILFCSTEAFLPELIGGAELSAETIAIELKKMGAEVQFHTGVSYRKPKKRYWILEAVYRNIFGSFKSIFFTRNNGFRIYRHLFPLKTLEDRYKKYQPDCIVIFAGDMFELSKILITKKKPIVYFHHTISAIKHPEHYKKTSEHCHISNSQYTKGIIDNALNLDSKILQPAMNFDKYKVKNKKSLYCTFINPKKEKGIDLFWKIAKSNPNISFLIVTGWPLSISEQKELKRELVNTPNVTLLPNQRDMRKIYKNTKLLLVLTGTNPLHPCEETWCRVATEAQINRIPVLASNVGALPESVGNGGILIDKNAELSEWNSIIYKLWNNINNLYDECVDGTSSNITQILSQKKQAEYIFNTIKNMNKKSLHCD